MNKKRNFNNRLYFSLATFFLACYFLRGLNVPFISAHISNFAITGFMLSLSLYADLYKRNLTKLSLFIAMGFWATINIVVECFVRLDTLHLPGVDFTNFNTPDPLDALFGLAGAMLFAFVILRFYFIKNRI